MDKYLNNDEKEELDIDIVSGVNIDNVKDVESDNEPQDENIEQDVVIKKAGVLLTIIALLAVAIIGIMIYLGIRNKTTGGAEVVIATTESEADTSFNETQDDETTTEVVTSTESSNRKYRKISGFLNEKEYPLVMALIYEYYDYLKDGDVDSLLDLLIINQEKDEFAERVNSSKDIVEDYENITCYMLKGLESDCYVVYVAYDIKFYNIDTPAPSLSRFYVQKDDFGRMVINQGEISNMLNMYLYAAAQYNHVKELINMVDAEYEQAKKEDAKLSFVMGYMR